MAKEQGPRWLKFDASYFANRKVLRAGRNGRDIFLAVLCMNATRGALGFIPLADWEPEYLARYVGLTTAEASDGMSRAVAAALLAIEGDRVSIVGWDEHWSSKSKTRAEIQRDYRERSGERYAEGNAALPTIPALPIEREIDRETERETPPAKRSLSASPLSGSWEPAAEAVALAAELGLEVKREAAKFADRMRSGERKSADWHAEFRNWLRRGAEFQERNGKRKPKPGSTRAASVRDVVFGASQQAENNEPQPASEAGKERKS